MSSRTTLSSANLWVDTALVVDRIRSSYYISTHEELREAGFKYDRMTVTRNIGHSWVRIEGLVTADVQTILSTGEDRSLVISRWLDEDVVSHHFLRTFLRENADRRGNPSLEKFHELFTRVYRTISDTQNTGVVHAGPV